MIDWSSAGFVLVATVFSVSAITLVAVLVTFIITGFRRWRFMKRIRTGSY